MVPTAHRERPRTKSPVTERPAPKRPSEPPSRGWLGTDPWLLVLALAASLLGVVAIFDAGYARSIRIDNAPIPREAISHFIYLLIGLAAAAWSARRGIAFWRRFAGATFWLWMVGLLFVEFFGREMNGAKRWIDIGPVHIQPAEFMKMAAVLYLAFVFAERLPLAPLRRRVRDRLDWLALVAWPRLKRWWPAIPVLVAVVLIEREPDLGTALVVVAVAFAMFFVGGVSRGSMIAILVLGFGGVAGMTYLEPYRLDRLLNHEQRWDASHVDDVGFQTVQAEMGFASGGLVGVGLGSGRAKHVMPAATTDFILATVGEETGLVGVLVVLGVVAALCMRMLYLAGRTGSPFARLVLCGVAFWIASQAAINTVMANGTLPAIGIPFPFLSFGGSSLVALWWAVGICQAAVAEPTRGWRNRLQLIVTGGGTGGHVYPALEIALAAQRAGARVRYLGSLRGQEGNACRKSGIDFQGFGSEPVYRLTTLRGWRALARLWKATGAVRKVLRAQRPDVIFSTGGYASAPIINAARGLRIPYVIHEQNSVPGRSNRLWSDHAKAVLTVFHATERHFPGGRVVRTGMPMRAALRDSAQGVLGFAQGMDHRVPMVLVMGGSQGAVALNDVALATAVRMARTPVQWLHLTGLSHFESTLATKEKLAVTSHYEVKAFLEAPEMAEALFACSLAVCRSGAGTLAELAAFRRPSVLVPYPHAFGDHQRENAREFEAMGGAIVLEQGALDAASLEARIGLWLHDEEKHRCATEALAQWDIPDAVPRVLQVLGV